jgi:glucose-1-phosphate thymidylyltransferase
MKIIVPMAGIGKRMRPHTLTIPKPLLPIAGKPIVQRLVEDIAAVTTEAIDEIAFIIGDFGKEVEAELVKVAEGLGAKGTIYHQDEALGTAHAIYCAEKSLDGKVIVAFADTLFRADFTLDTETDGIIWVKQIEDPRQFGVVKLDGEGVITDFIEKPETPVSDLAIIGIYFFKDGASLRSEIKHLLDNNIMEKGEYQITNALENMKLKGQKFKTGAVNEWLDCGNKDVTVYTNQRVLEFLKEKGENTVAASAKITNSTIIEPCYIGENAVISNSIVGPHVSVGDNTSVTKSVVENSIIQTNTKLKNVILSNSMIGNHTSIDKQAEDLSVGDYNSIS